jgi:hypothetical protein
MLYLKVADFNVYILFELYVKFNTHESKEIDLSIVKWHRNTWCNFEYFMDGLTDNLYMQYAFCAENTKTANYYRPLHHLLS